MKRLKTSLQSTMTDESLQFYVFLRYTSTRTLIDIDCVVTEFAHLNGTCLTLCL